MDNRPQFISTFIEIYRSFPCLWKVKDEVYHNKYLKDAAYGKLLDFYKSAVPGATIDTVKKKINNLKSAFRKELKKVRKHKSGSSAEDTYVSSLWYFDLLRFTEQHETPRQSISSAYEEYDQNETFCEDTFLLPERPEHSSPSSPLFLTPRPARSPSSSPLRNTPVPNLLPMPSTSSNRSEKTPSLSAKKKRTLINNAYKALKSDDEFDGIGINVACKLRRMNEDQRLVAETLINKVLLYGVKNRLSDDSDVTGLVGTRDSTFSKENTGMPGPPIQLIEVSEVEVLPPTRTQSQVSQSILKDVTNQGYGSDNFLSDY